MESKEFETLGIILAIKNHGDNDGVIKVLTQKGLFFLFARGIQKPNSKNKLNIPLLGLVNLEIIKPKIMGKIATLKRATLISFFPINPLLQDIFKNVNHFLNFMNNNNLDKLIETYKLFLNNVEEKPNHSYSLILLSFLEQLGHRPNFKSCVECINVDNIIDFEFYKGGFICNLHSSSKKEINFLKSVFWLNKDFNFYKNNINEKQAIKINLMIVEFLSSLI